MIENLRPTASGSGEVPALKPSLSAGRNADGRLPRRREPPIVPSGRQDLNLRPLDPQDVRVAVCARHKRSFEGKTCAPAMHEQACACLAVPDWSPASSRTTTIQPPHNAIKGWRHVRTARLAKPVERLQSL